MKIEFNIAYASLCWSLIAAMVFGISVETSNGLPLKESGLVVATILIGLMTFIAIVNTLSAICKAIQGKK